MRKLKLLLQSNYFYLILIFITLLYAGIRIQIGYESKIDPNSSFTGKIVSYQIKDDTKVLTLKNQEKIIVYLKNNDLKLGDIIKVTGTYEKPSNNTIPNDFNYKKYLYNNKTYYIMYNPKYEIISKNKSLRYKIKEYIIERSDKYQNKGYIKAFIIGDKSQLDYYNIYQENGISHLFAISGMHISFLSFFILFIFKKSKYKNTITLLFLLFYASLTNLSASIVRAILFFTLIMLKNKLELKTSNVNMLILTVSILLLINPLYLFDIGFLYSSVVTLGLLISSKYYKKKYLKNLLITSIIATLFSLPITINNNYEINILTIFNNMINVPFISFIIYPLSMITFAISKLEPVYNLFIILLEAINYGLSILSVYIVIPKLSYFIIIVYYLFLLLFILSNNKKYLIYLCLLLFCFKYWTIYTRDVEVTFLDVKQGDSSLIIMKDTSILIDTGGSLKDYYGKSIINFLKSKGLNKINYMITTHGDFDHMGDAIYIVNNIKVKNIILNVGSFNDLENELIKLMKKKKIKYYTGLKNLNIGKYRLQFLNTKEYDNENDNSNVIYFNYNNYKFLFMGDAGEIREKDILGKYNLTNIDFLKVGHHGSNTSSSKYFINSINPKYSIISVGKNNRYGHPKDSVLSNLLSSKIYRTDLDGSIEIKLNKNGYKMRTYTP